MSILRENLRHLQMLLEDRRDGIVKRFVPEIVKKWAEIIHPQMNWIDARVSRSVWSSMEQNEGRAKVAEFVIDQLMHGDPDPQKRYATWIVQTFVRGQLKLEDLERVRDAIAVYHNAKQAGQIARNHDLMRIKKLDDLYALVEPFAVDNRTNEIIDQNYVRKMEAQSEVVMNTERYHVLIPRTPEAAQWFGRNTDWCTAYGGKYARHPTRTQQIYKGDLFIITDKETGEQWQFHRETNQFMDSKDRGVERGYWVKDHPEVSKFFIERDLGQTVKMAEITGMYADQLSTTYLTLYDTGNSLMARAGIGLLATDPEITIYYSPSRKPGETSVRQIDRIEMRYGVERKLTDSDVRASFTKALNHCYLSGNHNTLNLAGIAWSKRRGFGDFQDVLAKFCETKEHVVLIAEGKDDSYYVCTKDEDSYDYVISKQSNGWTFTKNSAFTLADPETFADIALAWLVKKNDPDIIMDRYDYPPFTAIIPSDHSNMAVLAQKFPGAAPVHLDFAAHGDSPRVRERVTNLLHAVHSHWGEWVSDEVQFYEYSSVNELVENHGNDTATWIIGVMDGTEHNHVEGSASDGYSVVEDLLGDLTPLALSEVAAYLRENHDDDAAQWEEDKDEPLGADADDIREFLSDYCSDSEVTAAMDTAYISGLEVGAQNEMQTALEKSVRNAGWVFKTKRGWDASFKYDTPVSIFFSLAEVMKVVGQYSDEDWSDIEWANELEFKVDVQSPQYGFSDYDNEAAFDRFVEALAEGDIITSAGSKSIRDKLAKKATR